MGNFIDLAGKFFGRLVVIRQAGRDNRCNILWECICDCGNKIIVPSVRLKRGNTKSCGCLAKELSKKRMSEQAKTHGMSHTPTYYAWRHIRQRCLNKSDRNYHNYGGRGISVCERWFKFENFFEDMGECPEGLTIERSDNDKGYSPENCKWASWTEQAHNKRLRSKNKTGFAGIWWNDQRRKYEVTIGAKNKKFKLGKFERIEDAVIARSKGELKYWEKSLHPTTVGGTQSG